jgi:hypothetical protein
MWGLLPLILLLRLEHITTQLSTSQEYLRILSLCSHIPGHISQTLPRVSLKVLTWAQSEQGKGA